jgi:hypothetical protein
MLELLERQTRLTSKILGPLGLALIVGSTN